MRILRYFVAVLAFFAIVFVSIGFFVPRFDYQNHIEVNASVDKTFSVFTDVRQTPEWMQGLKRVEYVDDSPKGVGSQWRLFFTEGDRQMVMLQEVTAIKENELFAFKLDNEVLRAEAEVRFNRISAGTEMVQTTTVKGRNLFWRTLLWLSERSIIRRGQDNFDRFKHLVEQGRPAETFESLM